MRHILFPAAGIAATLTLAGATQGPTPAPAIVSVQLANFRFSPDRIMLDQGRDYVLRLHNVAGGGHDFTATEFLAAAAVAPASRGWIRRGSVEVPPGAVREIVLTAPAAGRYKVRCTHRFHRMLGMSGTITVR